MSCENYVPLYFKVFAQLLGSTWDKSSLSIYTDKLFTDKYTSFVEPIQHCYIKKRQNISLKLAKDPK